MDWVCFKTRLLIAEGHRRNAPGKETQLENHEQCYWIQCMQEDEDSEIKMQSWKKSA